MTKQFRRQHALQGFTLIELMVSMVLGLFVVGGVIGVYIANSRTSQVNEQMAQVQQASQISFQLLGKDVQHAGYSGCANITPPQVVNMLAPVPWWANWVGGLQGFDSAAPNFGGGSITPLATADSLHVMFGRGVSSTVVSHNALAAVPLVINENLGGIVTNDILLGCDSKMGVIFRASNVSFNNISHAVGGAVPANVSLNFGIAPDGTRYLRNLSNDVGTVMALESVAWFVGTQGGISSLYRVALLSGVIQTEEVIQNVDDLQLEYLEQNANNYVPAILVADWSMVMSVRATLTLTDNPTMPMALGMRQISQVINLRNRRQQ
ncbi:MAG: PilW family protein [Rheinheimera sp.]